MTGRQQRHGEPWVVRQGRRLGLGRSPLRRPADRLESTVLLLVLLLAVLAIPAAVALGTAVRGAAERSAEERRAELRSVQAYTLEDAPAVGAVPGMVVSWVKVGWQDASGRPRQGHAYVPVGTRADAAVTIWLDPSGVVAKPPRPAEDSAAIGQVATVTAVMVGWLVLGGLFRLAQVSLDRHRARDWDREWELVSARWKRNQH